LGVQLFAIALLAAGIAAVGLPGDAHAITSWFDDFNDGNATDGSPQTWSPHPALPGNYDASSGDYQFIPTDPFLDDQSMAASVESTVFTTASVRTRGFTTGGGNVLVAAGFDFPTVSGYLANIDNGGLLQLLTVVGGEVVEKVAEFDPNDQNPAFIDAGSDVVLQLDVVGQDLALTVWRPGELQPAEPQISGTSTFDFSSGTAGLVYNQDDPGSFGTFRFAKASAVKLIDGDMDSNGRVDFDDIAGFVLGLNNPADYEAAFGLAPVIQGDMDNNGKVDFDDIGLFVRRLTSGAASAAATAAVPEPSSLLLAGVALALASFLGRRRRAAG